MGEGATSGGEILVLQLQSAEDASLCLRKLQSAGLSIKADAVADVEEFKERLDTEYYDIILAACQLPDWSALAALSWMASKQFHDTDRTTTTTSTHAAWHYALRPGARGTSMLSESDNRAPRPRRRASASTCNRFWAWHHLMPLSRDIAQKT